MGFGYGCLGTILGYMSRNSTEEAKVVIELILMFLRCQFTIFAELWCKIRSGFLGFGSVSLGRARVVLLLRQRTFARLVF